MEDWTIYQGGRGAPAGNVLKESVFENVCDVMATCFLLYPHLHSALDDQNRSMDTLRIPQHGDFTITIFQLPVLVTK